MNVDGEAIRKPQRSWCLGQLSAGLPQEDDGPEYHDVGAGSALRRWADGEKPRNVVTFHMGNVKLFYQRISQGLMMINSDSWRLMVISGDSFMEITGDLTSCHDACQNICHMKFTRQYMYIYIYISKNRCQNTCQKFRICVT